MVLIERPRQGCTVVSSELVPSPLGARTGVGGGAATGERVTPPASPGRPEGDLGPDDWQCTNCVEDRPQNVRVRLPCCRGLICMVCTERIVQEERATVTELIRLHDG